MTPPAATTTTAIFLCKPVAQRIASRVRYMYQQTVTRCNIKRTDYGWIVIAHKADGTSAPVETSDVERLLS